ncbi:hypothetical protein KAW38_02005 [Candidatus Micrarchaeota archaeon]|nr:hypothetical protein [Candidatus Micrarchaeota archaeon]
MKKIFVLFVLGLLFLQGFASAQFFTNADDPAAQEVLEKTAQSLGWPTTMAPKTETTGIGYQISPYGAVQDPDIFAAIAVAQNDEQVFNILNILQDNGFRRTTYQGRDAVIMHPGDQICNPKQGTQLWWILEWVRGAATVIAQALGTESFNAEEICFDSYETYGWRCGKYLFIVQDQTDAGNGASIANSLYLRAEEANLCGIEDSVVILVESSDRSGVKTLSHFQDIAQEVNAYYSYNGYGEIGFTYTFFDADGAMGSDDWYTLSQPANSYKWSSFIGAAIKKAFTNKDLPEHVYLERIVVVHPGKGSQMGGGPKDTFFSACMWMNPSEVYEVQGLNNKIKIHAKNVVMVSEYDEVGTWAHEFGHTLYGKNIQQNGPGQVYRIVDRYNYDSNPSRKYGSIWSWGLMGTGNWWGNPSQTSPVHMSGFTKEAANWLRYKTITEFDKTYTEISLENKNMGDTILRIDDPQKADARFFYIMEARDSSVAFGAPESGVVLYKVGYDTTYNHYVVNNIWPQKGKTIGKVSEGEYVIPTLNSVSGNGSEYINVPAKFKITLQSESTSPYEAEIVVEEYIPLNLNGVITTPKALMNLLGGLIAGTPLPMAPPDSFANILGPIPQLDLHAYDSYGNHVGMNYETGEYENQIPGAIASGDLKDDEEWIFVPEGMDVRYELSAERAKQYLENNPEDVSDFEPEKAELTYVKFDASGAMYVADGGTTTVSPNVHTNLKPADDPSLDYRPDNIPGLNNNEEPCCCFPAFILLGLGLLAIKYK